MKDIIIKVEGMHCQGCENRIQNALKQIDGVEEVIANYKEGIVTVTVNNQIDIKTINEKIDDIGFTVKED